MLWGSFKVCAGYRYVPKPPRDRDVNNDLAFEFERVMHELTGKTSCSAYTDLDEVDPYQL